MPPLCSAPTSRPSLLPIGPPQGRFAGSIAGSSCWLRLGLVWAGLALSAAGCASSSLTGRLVDNPLPTAEQQDEVLKLVPVGTPRAEALETLANAGIEVHEGASNTIYYCDIWRRKDGSRWQMDVALLFDKQGNLYRTRSAQALTEVDSAAGLAEPNQPASRSASRGATSPPAAASPANSLYGVPAAPSSAPTPVPAFNPAADPASSRQRGSAPRVPFDARPPG